MGEASSLKDREVLVLLSGGIDSAACVDFYLRVGRPPAALFVDYGQPAISEERHAASAIAKHYSVPLIECAWTGVTPKAPGLIAGRNAFLVSVAVLERPTNASILALGIHGGVAYPDSSPGFVAATQHLLEFAGGPRLQLAAPFLDWAKADIYQYCRTREVPVSLTYSCEDRGGPCGQCLSCKDRRDFDAGP